MINEFRGKNFFLSNFYNCCIEFDGISYLNTEAAFQAQKTIDRNERYSFSKLNPSQAKSKGRHITLRSDWETVKIPLMKEIVKAKFTQNSDLKQKLLNTGNENLIEGNNWGDTFWGQVNGIGENHLGLILMEVREELKT